METVKWVRSPFIKVSKVKVYEKIKELNQKERRVFLIISRLVRLLCDNSKCNFIKTMMVSIVLGNIILVLFWLILYFIFNYLQSVLMRIEDYQQNIL